MSGLALLFRRDGAAVPEGDITRLLAGLAHRGPDGLEVAQQPGFALGHLHFWTTPEEVGEAQPLTGGDNQLHFAFDGRLDNRDELSEALGLEAAAAASLSDAALALASYERWACEAFERWLGPFAVALFDGRRRQVVCARDPLGARTLFYYLDPRLLAVGSEAGALASQRRVSADLDLVTVARYFAVQAPLPGSTFYAAVRELPPGCALAVDADGDRLWSWGALEAGDELRYARDDDYAEHFLELLERSVAARLRAVGPPAVLMSGGLDSGSIAAVAARQRAAAGEPALPAISWVFHELEAADERPYIEALVAGCGLESVAIPADEAWPLCDVDRWQRDPDSPLQGLYRRLQLDAYRQLRQRGGKVLLSGDGGDQLFAGGAAWLRDLLRQGRLPTAARQVVSGLGQLGEAPNGVGLKSGLLRLLRRPAAPAASAPWLTAEAQQLLAGNGEPEAVPHRRPEQWAALLDRRLVDAVTLAAGRASRAGVEVRRPMRDRRLVELALALPAHQLYRPGWRKWILRQATRGLLPEAVRQRRWVSTLFPLYARGLVERSAGLASELLSRRRAAWRRFVRPEWMSSVYPQRVRAAVDGVEAVVPWRAICYELWGSEPDRPAFDSVESVRTERSSLVTVS